LIFAISTSHHSAPTGNSYWQKIRRALNENAAPPSRRLSTIAFLVAKVTWT
jgi:hypothetical protein